MDKMTASTALALALFVLGAGAPAIADDQRAASGRLRALYEQLGGTAAAPQAARTAAQAGRVVDEARKQGLGLEELEILRELLDAMRARAGQLLLDAEHGTGQSEVALERLYRSQDWDDLGFAEASLIYWTAWLDLEISRHAGSGKDDILARARKGFQTASLQMFRPGLFYGGWLGIGCVAVEQGQHTRAQQIFEKLEEALSALPDTSISKAISLEIRLQEMRMGTFRAPGAGKHIDANQADVLRTEVFALLEQSRSEGRAFAGITYRLQALTKAGYVDQPLLEDLMAYAREIAAVDARPWSVLAAAEFRLQHQDYRNASQKYEAFFKEFIPQPGVNPDRFRYHWAFAAYKTGHYQTALRILEKLARRDGLPAETDKAVARLLYVVHVARAQRGDAKTDHKSLLRAARRFIDSNPDDAEADKARLYLAQTSPDPGTSLKTLGRIRSTAEFGGEVERATFHFIAREFSARIASGNVETAVDLAHRGLDAYNALPGTDRENLLNVALLLQMRALVEPNPVELVQSLDFLDNLKNFEAEERQALSAAHPDAMIRSLGPAIVRKEPDVVVHQAISWSRLQLYDRTGNWSGLTKLLHSLTEGNAPGLPLELIYPWIASREDTLQRLELAQLVHPAAAALPDVDRRLYRIVIECLLSAGDHEAAHKKALAFTRAHPNSGDAWRLLARAAELVNDHFAADQAWSIITDKTTASMEIWWEGMLNRVRIRSGSTRPEQACPLLELLQRRAAHLPESQKTEYETLLANTRCRRVNSAI